MYELTEQASTELQVEMFGVFNNSVSVKQTTYSHQQDEILIAVRKLY